MYILIVHNFMFTADPELSWLSATFCRNFHPLGCKGHVIKSTRERRVLQLVCPIDGRALHELARELCVGQAVVGDLINRSSEDVFVYDCYINGGSMCVPSTS